MSSKKYSSWWLLLVAGTMLILIGVFAIIQPWDTFVYLVKYLGFVLLLSSVFLFIHAFAIKILRGEAKWLITEALADLTLASVLVLNPFLAIVAFNLLIGIWIIVRGVIKILHYAFIQKAVYGADSILVVGLISIVAGMLIIMFPTVKVDGVGYAICIFALLSGGLYIFNAIRFKKFENTLVALL